MTKSGFIFFVIEFLTFEGVNPRLEVAISVQMCMSMCNDLNTSISLYCVLPIARLTIWTDFSISIAQFQQRFPPPIVPESDCRQSLITRWWKGPRVRIPHLYLNSSCRKFLRGMIDWDVHPTSSSKGTLPVHLRGRQYHSVTVVPARFDIRWSFRTNQPPQKLCWCCFSACRC